MTKKDLFRVTLKLVGLYFIITVLFNSLPSLIVFATAGGSSLVGLITMLVGILIFVLIFVSLIFKPDAIINLFKLDKNFDDDVVMIKRPSFSNMLQWGIILIALSLLFRQLPGFIVNLLFAFKFFVIDSGKDITNHLHFAMLTNYVEWGVNIVSLAIAFLIITNSKTITDYIIKKSSENKIDKDYE